MLVFSALLVLSSIVTSQTKPPADPWEPFRYFIGTWEGTGSGKPGVSKTQREYRFVLNGKFLQIQNRSVYDPQPKNPKGETHEDWGMLSFDKSRKQFVLRQYHVEGFVSQYVLTSSSADWRTLVLTTNAIENIPAGWRARETYKILNADEFVEVFELAEPGKEFEIYTENRYQRVRKNENR